MYKASESKRVESIRKRRVSRMSPSDRQDYRKKTAARVVKCRQAKKEKRMNVNVQSLTGSKRNGYKSKQALSKAVNHVMKNMPSSPTRQLLTFSGVAKKIGVNLETKFGKAMSDDHSRSLSQDTVDAVDSFYHRSDIVWTAPGMKDEITLWEGGVKRKLRKYFLTMYLREAFEIFKSSFPDINIGFSKFCSLRPKNVLLLKDTPRDQCKCMKHENFINMLSGLNLSYSNSFWENILCDSNDLCGICWKGKCEMCCEGKKLAECLGVKDHKVYWDEWVKNDSGRLRLETRSCCEGELLEKIIDGLPLFQDHVRIKRVQSNAFNSDKFDSETSVLQCDFAMAYSCEYQKEIQSALWGRESVNLFTAAFYHGNEPCKSYLIVTDSQDKGKDTVSTFIRELLLAEETRLKKKLIIYTDGPSGEFKNKFMIKLLADLSGELNGCKVEWKYFATSHGKGVVDGIGGSAKSLVRQSVMARGNGVIVQGAHDFAKEVKKLMPNINVKYVSQEKICKSINIRNPWCGVKDVPGVRKAHFMACEGNGCVALYTDTTSSELLNKVRYGNVCVSDNVALYPSEVKNVDCKLGDWVLVKYDGKTYPGEVTGLGSGQGVQVSVMRKAYLGQNWKWPDKKDEILYEHHNILKKIDPPVPIGTRGQFTFNSQF